MRVLVRRGIPPDELLVNYGPYFDVYLCRYENGRAYCNFSYDVGRVYVGDDALWVDAEAGWYDSIAKAVEEGYRDGCFEGVEAEVEECYDCVDEGNANAIFLKCNFDEELDALLLLPQHPEGRYDEDHDRNYDEQIH